jgi:tetratricopeptide (TPR) repeat protein
MTEREKLRTVGGYYIGIARNPDKAIETYELLVAKYPADSAGYNNLAIAYFSTLNFAKAFEYGRKAIEIYPKTYKYRSNYALYAMYAGDFKTVAEIAQPLIKEDPKVDVPYLPLAMEALVAGDIPRARGVYQQATQAGDAGMSLRALGIADIAIYEGRYDEALSILPSAAKRDQDQHNILGAASKLVALAEAYQGARQRRGAADVDRAGARPVNAGERARARGPARHRRGTSRRGAQDRCGARAAPLRPEPRLREDDRRGNRDRREAIRRGRRCAQRRTEAADLWLVRFALGLAYFHHGDYPEAVSEFEKCRERRGEATAVFLDDLPTVPLLRHAALLARARARDAEARRAAAVPGVPADPPGATGDPLVEDARRRIRSRRQVTPTSVPHKPPDTLAAVHISGVTSMREPRARSGTAEKSRRRCHNFRTDRWCAIESWQVELSERAG